MSNNGAKKPKRNAPPNTRQCLRVDDEKERPEVGFGSTTQFSSNFFSFDVCFSFAHMCAKRNGVRSSNDLISYCRISRNRFAAILMLTHQFDFDSFILERFAFHRSFPSFIIVFLFCLICWCVCARFPFHFFFVFFPTV